MVLHLLGCQHKRDFLIVSQKLAYLRDAKNFCQFLKQTIIFCLYTETKIYLYTYYQTIIKKNSRIIKLLRVQQLSFVILTKSNEKLLVFTLAFLNDSFLHILCFYKM